MVSKHCCDLCECTSSIRYVVGEPLEKGIGEDIEANRVRTDMDKKQISEFFTTKCAGACTEQLRQVLVGRRWHLPEGVLSSSRKFCRLPSSTLLSRLRTLKTRCEADQGCEESFPQPPTNSKSVKMR